MRVDGFAFGVQEKRVGGISLPELLFSDMKIRKKNGMESRSEGNYSLFGSFAVDEKLADRQIDLPHSDIAKFRDTNPTQIESLQNCAVAVSFLIVRKIARLEH